MIVVKKYLELEVIVFILAGVAAGFFVLHQVNAQKIQLAQTFQEQTASLIGSYSPTSIPTPTPTPPPTPTPTLRPTPTPLPVLDKNTAPTVAFTPTGATTFQTSSDGTRKVIINSTTNLDGSTTYNVTTDSSSNIIFSKTLPEGSSISIPYNTWSPDNTYFYIEENDGTQLKYMVFNGTGETFTNGQAFLDLTGVFAQDDPNSVLSTASGWASDNLIIILTKNSDGSEGTSYWFGVPDESVTPLATLF